MSEAKHTPGPWVLHDALSDSCWTIRAGDESLMGSATYYPWVPEKHEDWMLIAAAPELLSNLQFAVKLMRPIFGGSAQVEHMESVIAKATGSAA